MRQFLALEPDESVRNELVELQRRFRPRLAGWRWIDPGAIHLTLRFLGEVADALDVRARPVWRTQAAANPPLELRLGAVGCFPPRGRPRVLWSGVEAVGDTDRLAALAERYETGACRLGFEASGRRFRPHLTLARSIRAERAGRPSATDLVSPVRFRVSTVTLFRSVLSSAGARYEILERFPLGGAPVDRAELAPAF